MVNCGQGGHDGQRHRTPFWKDTTTSLCQATREVTARSSPFMNRFHRLEGRIKKGWLSIATGNMAYHTISNEMAKSKKIHMRKLVTQQTLLAWWNLTTVVNHWSTKSFVNQMVQMEKMHLTTAQSKLLIHCSRK